MNCSAFAFPTVHFVPQRTAAWHSVSPASTRQLRVSKRPVHERSRWQANTSPENDRTTGNTPEDDELHSELRAKVNELFGGRHNVKIDVNTDSDVQFFVQRKKHSNPVLEWMRTPSYVFTFIIVVSLITGTFFTVLYYSGAIHGFNSSDDGHYEMPSYGSSSYIDPYELLKRDRELQDSKYQ